MSTRDIQTSHEIAMCDVCGRTLLRGERADVWVNGGARRSVCELCKARALHEGWVREGTVPAFQGSETGSERRRSLLGRFRPRQKEPVVPPFDDASGAGGAHGAGDASLGHAGDAGDAGAGASDAGAYYQPGTGITLSPPPENQDPAPPENQDPAPPENQDPAPPENQDPADGRSGQAGATAASRPARGPAGAWSRRPQDGRRTREPRHVRAVPSGIEHKIAAAADLFNRSEHRRTVSGVSRSLGQPSVTITPTSQPSLVVVVIAWELCWYRYDVDLSEEEGVRVSGQGYELHELEPAERQHNAIADESGQLSLP